MLIRVCVGSACHLKGAPEIVELLRQAVEEHLIAHEVTLAGSFCVGKCSRVGVTVQVNDDVHTGITRENFREFFNEYILKELKSERKSTERQWSGSSGKTFPTRLSC